MDAYVAKLLNLLGSRDPLGVLSETPGVLAGIVAKHAPEFLQRRPFEGKWTPNEIIGHLADTEWVFGFRVRMILCHEEPQILAMDQDLWVAGQRRNERQPTDQLAEFRTLREINLALWRRMKPADLERAGLHAERGRETLATMLRMEAGHDLSHIDQITRYIAALGPA
ncbi:MAG: DinB family protein [Phycisphaerae bacterium]